MIALYIVHCIHCAVYSVHCTVHTVHYALYLCYLLNNIGITELDLRLNNLSAQESTSAFIDHHCCVNK